MDMVLKLWIELAKLPVPTVLMVVGVGLVVLALVEIEKFQVKNRWLVGLIGGLMMVTGFGLYVPVALQPALAAMDVPAATNPAPGARPVGVAVGGATNAAPAVSPTPRPLWVEYLSTGDGGIVSYTVDLEDGGFLVGVTAGLDGDKTECIGFYAAGPALVSFTLESGGWNRYENVFTTDQQNELIEERRNYLEQHHPTCKYRVAKMVSLTP